MYSYIETCLSPLPEIHLQGIKIMQKQDRRDRAERTDGESKDHKTVSGTLRHRSDSRCGYRKSAPYEIFREGLF